MYAKQLAEGVADPFSDENIEWTFARNGSPFLYDTETFRSAHNSFPNKDGAWEQLASGQHAQIMTRENGDSVDATERYVLIAKDHGKLPPIKLCDLDDAQLLGLFHMMGLIYPGSGEPELDMMLVRNGRESGHTIDHFHAHLASVIPGQSVSLFNGNYRAQFPDGNGAAAISCLSGFSLPSYHRARSDKGGPIRVAEVKSTATGVKSHQIVYLHDVEARTPLDLDSELAAELFHELGIRARTGAHFIYWERAKNPLLPDDMILPFHIVEVAKDACVRVLGTPFPA